MNQVHGTSRVVALVPAAGRGVRLGESIPKAFVPVGGMPMLTLAVDGLIASGVVDHIVIAAPAELIDEARILLGHRAEPACPVPVSVVAGGAERTDSVRAGIAAAPEATHFLVHDAARALTPPAMIARVVAELRSGCPAVVPGLPVADTIKSVNADGEVTGTPDRAVLRAIQTPQGFHADLLREAYAAGIPATDDAGLVEQAGARVHVIPGDPLAFKITTPLDLRLARALLAERDNPELPDDADPSDVTTRPVTSAVSGDRISTNAISTNATASAGRTASQNRPASADHAAPRDDTRSSESHTASANRTTAPGRPAPADNQIPTNTTATPGHTASPNYAASQDHTASPEDHTASANRTTATGRPATADRPASMNTASR